jgi:hypothetical protein
VGWAWVAGAFAFGGCTAFPSRQDATLKELHAMTGRIARLAQAEHDLIRREVEPKVHQIKEHVESVKDAVSPGENLAGRFTMRRPNQIDEANSESFRSR